MSNVNKLKSVSVQLISQNGALWAYPLAAGVDGGLPGPVGMAAGPSGPAPHQPGLPGHQPLERDPLPGQGRPRLDNQPIPDQGKPLIS
jgi:hypothetical protein